MNSKMQIEKDETLLSTWDKRWEGSDISERLTFLGRMMFKAKEKAILKVLGTISFKTVIEVGCGLGYTMLVYKNAGYDCIGIDASKQAVEACRRKELNCRQITLSELSDNLEKEDVESSIYSNFDISKKYDLVSSDGMLEHFLNFEPYAVQMMNISRKYVLLIQPNHDSFAGKTLAYLSELIKKDENVFEYNYRVADFISIFKKHRFNIVNNQPIFGDVFRLLLFQAAD